MLKEEQKNQLIALHKVCFNDGDYAEFFFENRMPQCKAYLVESEGVIVSACYARFFDLALNGKVVKIPFLTGVATSPLHRYKGFAREVVEKAKAELKKEGYPFVLLHPFNHDFYRKLGFETINYVTRITPTKTALDNVVFRKMQADDLPLVSELYNQIISTYVGYRIRTLNECELLIGNSLKHGGFGYLIYENNIPCGYIWCEDGVCVEALAKREELFAGAPLPKGYTIPLFGGNVDYSMGAILSYEELLKTIPYNKVSGEVVFKIDEVNYKLIVKEGRFSNLTTTLSEGFAISERELILICFGQGNRVKNNPFKETIPTYELACFEIY